MFASKVPELRFKGFSGEWEEKKLSEITSIGTGRSSFNTNQKKSYINQYAILGSRAIIGYDSSFDYFGDFILTARVGENAGKLYKYSGKVKITDNTVFIKSKNLDFIFFTLIKYDLKRLSFGTGQPLIKASELNNLKLWCPTDLNEQTKIGNYFQKLDILIEQKQIKHQKLKQLKKAMLAKMFPKDGATLPEVRFKGFSGEWEEFQFENIFERIASKKYQIKSNEYQDFGKYPVIDQGKNLVIGYSNNIKKLYRNCSIIIFGDHTRELKFIDFDFIVGADGTQLIKTKNKFDNKFFYYSLLKKTIPNTGYNRHFKFLLEMSFCSPLLEEQTKIGNYFQKLDKLIDLQLQELEKLKNIKKASLAKMFV